MAKGSLIIKDTNFPEGYEKGLVGVIYIGPIPVLSPGRPVKAPAIS